MSRVIFDANETDQQFQIEDGIRRTLETNSVASVEQSVIEKCYDFANDDGDAVERGINDKCGQLAERGNWDYSLHENLAIFRPKRK